ncbi:ComF family protein [Jeotgalibacillus salarius]|uniref:ComF family protein n=1 Tax=Jeotgalibacillus salarius TaxID=546023 RepID=A0A4Y8LLX7_9BACL|nr:ComF family protein [Jeotgalibacillus salarius]TFE03956.1 ComF family protein [Jeotgalibacillus salarius]
MRCLYCHAVIHEEMSWSDLLFKRIEDPFCGICKSGLLEIKKENSCSVCSGKMEGSGTCGDCLIWNEHQMYHDVLHSNRSLYEYNQLLKEMIKRFKYNGDYAVAGCFRKKIIEEVKKLPRQTLLVPVPVSEERLQTRGFNQTEALLVMAGLKFECLLTRKNEEVSQAKKLKHDRHSGENPFKAIQQLNGENILLMDDLYTTGTTIRRAAHILKEAGAGEVRSLTIGR